MIAAIGNAGGAPSSTTVMPFILRGVRLIGVPTWNNPTRAHAGGSGGRLASDLKPQARWQRVARRIRFEALESRRSTTCSRRASRGRQAVDFSLG